jgi:hypothetical protein
MPFDGVPLDTPSLKALAFALRHPETWPPEFAARGWDYATRSRCAMGLAVALWPQIEPAPGWDGTSEWAEEQFGISTRAAKRLFYLLPDGDRSAVQPYHVAGAIDFYLAFRW